MYSQFSSGHITPHDAYNLLENALFYIFQHHPGNVEAEHILSRCLKRVSIDLMTTAALEEMEGICSS